MLEISREGITKPKIFNSLSYVSESQVNRILAYVVENRLLQFTDTNMRYVTTNKGYTHT